MSEVKVGTVYYYSGWGSVGWVRVMKIHRTRVGVERSNGYQETLSKRYLWAIDSPRGRNYAATYGDLPHKWRTPASEKGGPSDG